MRALARFCFAHRRIFVKLRVAVGFFSGKKIKPENPSVFAVNMCQYIYIYLLTDRWIDGWMD
jgi:hypothetical protein